MTANPRQNADSQAVLVDRAALELILSLYDDGDTTVTQQSTLARDTIRVDVARHDAERAEVEQRGTVSDGYQEWVKCERAHCGLAVVRMGKVQCWCDDGSEEPPNVGGL